LAAGATLSSPGVAGVFAPPSITISNDEAGSGGGAGASGGSSTNSTSSSACSSTDPMSIGRSRIARRRRHRSGGVSGLSIRLGG